MTDLDGATPLEGARVFAPPGLTPEAFDFAHEAEARGRLAHVLAAQAYGDEYPREIQAFGMTTWWTLGRLVAGCRLNPGDHLVDLACGRGGPGLWLARATGARLTGVDWSPAAVRLATARAPLFVEPDRATFAVGSLDNCGLPDRCADAVICLDAVFFAEDRLAAFAEVRRVLRPGGRFMFTADHNDRPTAPQHVRDWLPLIAAADLHLEDAQQVPRWAERLGAMYQLWEQNYGDLVTDLGRELADAHLYEARTVGPTLVARRGMLFCARRPT